MFAMIHPIVCNRLRNSPYAIREPLGASRAGASPLSHPPGLGPLPRSHGNAEGQAHAQKRNLRNEQAGRRPPPIVGNCDEARSQLCGSCRSEMCAVNKIPQAKGRRRPARALRPGLRG